MYKPITGLSELRKACQSVLVRKPHAIGEHPTISVVNTGDAVEFTTAQIDAKGTVLGIDKGAVYPIRIEFHDKCGNKRILPFSPDEFITFKLKES